MLCLFLYISGPMVAYDYGIVTDTNVMPIIKLNLGGQSTPGATATATVGDVRCGPTPFGKFIDVFSD